MVLNPLIVEQRYQEYLKQRERQKAMYAEVDKQRQELQSTIKAKVAATRLNEIHTAQDEYICECCGKAIPEGTRYRRQNIPNGSGWPEGVHFTQRITHLICNVSKCTFFEDCGNSQSGLCNNEFGRESYRDCGVYKKKSEASA